MNRILFFPLCLSVSSVVAQTTIDAALSLPKRTENLVYRDRLKATWLPDGKSFWYQVRTGPKSREYVLIQVETGERKTSETLKGLGLPDKGEQKTSAAEVKLRKTQHTGEESSLKFINQLSEDVDLFWINQDGEHVRFGGIKAGMEREQHSYEGHVWLLTSRTGEHLAVLEAAALPQTFVIDGKGINPAKTEPQEKAKPKPQKVEAWTVKSKAQPVTPRQVTIVESSPADGLQPKTKVIDYIKPGDPLPKPQLVITHADGKQIPVHTDLYDNPFNPGGRIDVTWAPDRQEFYFDYNQRGHQIYRILACDPRTGKVRVVVEETSKTFIHYSGKSWRHWLHSSGELIWMSERDGWCHLWMYEVKSGKPKHQITRGSWVVREVLQVDESTRQIWFYASGLKAEEDPYHLHLCRVGFDGKGFQQLTAADGNHRIEFSPDRRHFIDAW